MTTLINAMLLAQTAAAAAGAEPISHDFLGKLVVGLSILAGLGLLGTPAAFLAGKKLKVEQPIEISLREKFATKEDLAELRAVVRENAGRAEALMQRIFDKIDERDQRLSEKIEKVAKADHDARVMLWDELNSVRDRTAKLESRCEAQHPHFAARQQKG